MSQIFDRISDFFRPLSGAQKMLFGLLSAGVFMLVGMLFYWALQPSYAVLFQSLSSESAQTIVQKLQSSDVSYELADNGHTIKVPRAQVYDLRLKYADEGASGSNYEGYKLFDKNSLGMTDFMQRLNKKRALEGELARTINSLEQVKSSRVHIVLPERSPFQETEVKPSSSVVLEMNPSQNLTDKQIRGISALIAGSVEKLEPNEVTILDQHGNQISKNDADDELAGSSRQMQVRQETENYLKGKGQSMLDRVVGPGNSILRVSTEHNFNKITRQSNKIDPESKTIISEERHEQTNSNKTQNKTSAPAGAQTNGATKAQQNNSTVDIKNYEISKTNEHLENMVGDITHISASVLLNYKQEMKKTADGKETKTYVPHSKEEIAEIKQAMTTALGINKNRGDEISITQIKFQDPYSLNPQPQSFFGDSFSIYQLIRWILMAIVAAIIGYLMYRTSQGVLTEGFNPKALMRGGIEQNPQNMLTGETEGETDIYRQKLSEEAREELGKPSREKKDIDQFVEAHTSQAANLVRLLIAQDK